MIDLLNFIIGSVCAFVLGLAAHSIYLHARSRGDVKRKFPWDHLDDLEEEKK
jgi:hypothetical protein